MGYKAQTRWYYIQDHLGSVVGILSSTGTYSGGYSYSTYGEARATGTTAAVTTNTLRYIAGYHDGNGIYKLGARYYDTSLGRFTQMDPSGQERSPYAYGACNPVNAKDPSELNAVADWANTCGGAVTIFAAEVILFEVSLIGGAFATAFTGGLAGVGATALLFLS